VLVRHRHTLQRSITSAKCRLRHKLAFYNADVKGLFTVRGRAYLAQLPMSPADRFECDSLLEQLAFFQKQLLAAEERLVAFAKSAPTAEREARAVLETMPEVGQVTADVVLSETGDVRRFRSAKRIVAFAGLDPGFRQSAGKTHELHITKEGSRLLRWALVETAWRLVRKSARWRHLFLRLHLATGHKKKAIVGVARRVLCVMYAMLRDGTAYRPAAV
jgi:transposase